MNRIGCPRAESGGCGGSAGCISGERLQPRDARSSGGGGIMDIGSQVGEQHGGAAVPNKQGVPW